MTIPEYMTRAMALLEASGMSRKRILTDIMLSCDYNRLERMLEGSLTPTILLLERLEAASGLSLDAADPRIHRAEALAGGLAAAIQERKWSKNNLAGALEISGWALRKMLDRGSLGAFAKPELAARLCDALEGRLAVMTLAEADQKAREAQMATREMEKHPSLPPEARGDPAWMTAKRAFWRCVGSNPKRFRLRKSETDAAVAGSLFLAEGQIIAYRFRVEGERVDFTAAFRRTGRMLAERTLHI